MLGELAEVLIVPRWLDAPKHAGSGLSVVPANAEAIAVGRFSTEPRVQALIDQ
jgi:hypothetical protein